MYFGPWLSTQRAREIMRGVDHQDLVCNPSALTEYAHLHLTDTRRTLERAALLIPTTGLPDDEQRAMWATMRSAFADHLVETLEQLGALFNAIGCSDRELELRYGAVPESHQFGETVTENYDDANDPSEEPCASGVDKSPATRN